MLEHTKRQVHKKFYNMRCLVLFITAVCLLIFYIRCCVYGFEKTERKLLRGTQRQFSENICSEDDLRSRTFGTFVVKFLACLPFLGFSNI